MVFDFLNVFFSRHFSSLGILVTASQDESSKYNYNTICVVLITEFAKLIASTVLYCRRYNLPHLIR